VRPEARPQSGGQKHGIHVVSFLGATDYSREEEFINFSDNAEVGELIFSGKNSSSERAALDDEGYEFSAFGDLATHARDEGCVAVAWDKWVHFGLKEGELLCVE
jgi:hypothetical protein